MKQEVTQLFNVNFVYQVYLDRVPCGLERERIGWEWEGTNCSRRDNLEKRQLLGNCQIHSEERMVETKNWRERTYI